jgi:hypothetical protein
VTANGFRWCRLIPSELQILYTVAFFSNDRTRGCIYGKQTKKSHKFSRWIADLCRTQQFFCHAISVSV